jgi:hypothetical protein
MLANNSPEVAPMKYDVVYYWNRSKAAWVAADPSCPVSLGGVGGDVNALVARLERAGYVALRGKLSIGAPEGAPSADRLAAALAVR